MKKKRTCWIIVIIVLIILAIGVGLIIKKSFEPEAKKVNKSVSAETGETIPVKELVSADNYVSASISPKIILLEGFSDAEVRDNGQSVYLGYTMSCFEVIVYVTDEQGKVTEERVLVAPKIKD